MRKLSTLLIAVGLSFSMIACGGLPGTGGGSGTDAYTELATTPATIEAEFKKITAPIDGTEALITELEAAPAKYKLSAADFKTMLNDSVAGKTPAKAGDLDAKAQKELDDLFARTKQIKADLVATPDNTAALLKKLPGMTINAATLTGKATADAQMKLKNPLSDAKTKAEAQKRLDGIEGVKAESLGAITKVQGDLAGVPARSVTALGNLSTAMGSAATDSAGEATKAATTPAPASK